MYIYKIDNVSKTSKLSSVFLDTLFRFEEIFPGSI